jgi:MFS family permease
VRRSYALVLAVLLLPAATLGDRLGRGRLFLAGMVVFTAGSLAYALFAIAAVALAGFAIYELRIAGSPMTDLRLFQRRSFALGITSTGLASAALSAVEPARAGMAAGLTNTMTCPQRCRQPTPVTILPGRMPRRHP